MPRISRRWRRLGLTALATLAFFFLFAVQLPLFFGRFPRRPQTADFLNYLAAAHVGLEQGWSRIYDLELQAASYRALSGSPDFQWYYAFVSPPPVAWLVAPLVRLPVDAGYWTWTAISAAALAYACWRVSPWRGLPRVAALLVGFGLYPVLIALQFGQVTPLIAACTALAWWQLREGHQARAGALLVAIVLKPQVAVLVPLALGLAGHRRCFAVWAAGAAAIAAAAVLSLGMPGIAQYVSDLAVEQQHLDNQVWTVASLVGPGSLATAIELGFAALALVFSALARGAASSLPLVAGALGSLLGAGYHHSIDFVSVLPLGLIQVATAPPPVAAALCLGGVTACYLTPRFGPVPILLVLAAWFLGAGATALRSLWLGREGS